MGNFTASDSNEEALEKLKVFQNSNRQNN